MVSSDNGVADGNGRSGPRNGSSLPSEPYRGGCEMKRFMMMTAAVVTMSVSLPVYATEMTSEQKDECLLASSACKDQVDSIQQKIGRLNSEIRKGNKVYTAAELKRLSDKLKDAEAMLDTITRGE
jgi:hypothetical protein